ncbi:hypothetical protein PQR53_03140 [Paraburkholderia fungorum]|uniref:hypothetical protein n=1 Tax=Paraburkholderia fungorum TaxID=134537 RepID=UPI0038B8226C
MSITLFQIAIPQTAPANKKPQEAVPATQEGSWTRRDETTRRSKAARVAEERLKRGVYEERFGARSVAGRMTAVSLTLNVRGHGFQMRHYGDCAGDPLMSWRCEPLSFAYFFFAAGKEK